MNRKVAVVSVVAISLAAVAAALAARPSGAAHRPYTVAWVNFYIPALAKGGREAAGRLGVRYIAKESNDGEPGAIELYKSMIARHVDAILSGGYDPALKPVFRKVRKAGILLIASGDDIAGPRDLWVGPSDPIAYGHALADALASQIHGKGEYAILRERGEFPIADKWAKIVQAYVPRAYPHMKLDGVLTETGAGGENEVNSIKSYMAAHPNLVGLIGIAPTEAWCEADAITQAGRIGQVFSAGNAGGGLAGTPQAGWVRSGATEVVLTANQNTLGYLTVWAANYLLSGHHFRPGAYHVGGPVGLVWYYAKHQELRLGQPLTITKSNVDRYAKTL
jgi:rhamnose transport system substrate-binding protein